MTDAELLHGKYDRLLACLGNLGSTAVAFSGGVDSTLLLHAAHEALGAKAVALTARAPMVPEREIDEARAFCEQHGIRQVIVDTRQFDIEGFADNPENRCYLCKREMFSTFVQTAVRLGLESIVEGSNIDDESTWRPGARALDELHVESPLREAGLSKQEIRDLSRELGLPTWDKPSHSCLLSRFGYGERITAEKLTTVDHAEATLIGLGFTQVRVRVHGTDARVEVQPDDIARAAGEPLRSKIAATLRAGGFVHVSLDLMGYRFGSMDEGLRPDGGCDMTAAGGGVA